MVEFANSVKEIALNLENENVGIVVFGSDTAIKRRRFFQAHWIHCGSMFPQERLGCVVDALGVPIDGRGSLSDQERRQTHVATKINEAIDCSELPVGMAGIGQCSRSMGASPSVLGSALSDLKYHCAATSLEVIQEDGNPPQNNQFVDE
ncbi:hypothetical protein Vadar_001342 [Vaccinium darrowii]|uniref:Uncharacterized protein n=1 Tax=Vaccinium darrowii TaxID=229202 RepID=A0ACB7Y451_9ERIC|nr:hypothetical protein Vadar_001342 [Vaccinium darrowii]